MLVAWRSAQVIAKKDSLEETLLLVGRCAAQESANGLGGRGGADDEGDNGNAPNSEPWVVGMIDSGAERSGMSPHA